MATNGSAKESLPVLVVVEMDYADGGSSPWFNGKGRSVLSGMTTEPEDAGLFTELARDGTMATLVSFLDTAQPYVSTVATLCYILLGMVLLLLCVGLPVAAFGLRRYTRKVGVIPWLCCEVVLLACAVIQLICLLSMISTWYGMGDGLETKTPQAYEWTFELLRNYTILTFHQLKKGTAPDVHKKLDLNQATTMEGIKWMQGNLSAWEDSYSGHAALTSMLTGVLPILQMGVLALAVAAAVGTVLLGFATWNRRQKALKKGRRSPVFTAFVALACAVLLFTHAIVALIMIARWLPVGVLGETYLCAPYRDGNLVVHDDAVGKVWPLENRPSPFCRLVPSALASRCTNKNETGIEQLPTCPGADANNTKAALTASLRVLQGPPAKRNSAPEIATVAKMISGDCFYPYKIFDTDMTSACPLLTDELVGHWMALVFSVFFGILGALAAAAIAVIFLTIGKKKKKKKRKKIVRKRRIRKKDKSTSTPPPTPPPPPPPPPEPSEVNIAVQVPAPMPLIIPQRRRRRRHHHCRSDPPIILVSSPPCSHPAPALMAAPLPFTPAVMPSMAMPVGAVSQFAAAPVPTSPTISAVTTRRSPQCCGCNESCSAECSVGYTDANFCGSGGVLTMAPGRSMVFAAPQPSYSRVLSPLRRAASLCTLRRSTVVHRSRNAAPAALSFLPGNPLVRVVPGSVQPVVTRQATYTLPRRV